MDTKDDVAAARSPRHRRWIGAGCVLLLVVTVLAFVAFVYGLGDDNLVVRSYDFREMHGFHKQFYRAALRDGRLPLWQPHTFSGAPFAANPATQTFYPLSLVYLLPPARAALADALLHLWLAAIGVYLLLRLSFELGRGAAVFGALAFALCGRFVGQVYAGHLPYWAAGAYIPWLLLAVERGATRLTLHESRAPAGRWGFGRLSLELIALPWLWVAAGAAALQILAGGMQYVAYTLTFAALYRFGMVLRRTPRQWSSWRREAFLLVFVSVAACAMSAVQLIPSYELLRLSNRAHTGYEYAAELSYPPDLLPGFFLGGLGNKGYKYFWEYYGYAGVLPSVLCLGALLRVRRDARVLVLAVIAAATLVFMVGDHAFLYPFLWKYVPGFGLFRAPARGLIVVLLIAALLAAVGLDAVASWLSRRSGARFATVCVALLCLVTVADLAAFARMNRGRIVISERGFSQRPDHIKLEQILRSDPTWYRYWFGRRLFEENYAYALGAHSVGGYEILQLQRYRRFMYFMADTELSATPVTILTQQLFVNAPSGFPFKVLGTKYATRDNQILGRARPVRRAWFVSDVHAAAGEEEALAYMRSDRFRPDDEVVLEPPEASTLAPFTARLEGSSPPAGNVTVSVVDLSPQHLRIEIGPHADGYLVLSEIFYPGWRARIGGNVVPIHRCDFVLRCLAVGADQSEIDMAFAPASVRLGAIVSAFTWVAALGIVVWRGRGAYN